MKNNDITPVVANNLKLNQSQLNALTKSIKNMYEMFLEFKKYTDTPEFITALYSKGLEERINARYESILQLRDAETSSEHNYERIYNTMKNWKEYKLFIKNLIEELEKEQIQLLANLRLYNYNMNIHKQIGNMDYQLFNIKNLITLTKKCFHNDNYSLYLEMYDYLEEAYGIAKTIHFNMSKQINNMCCNKVSVEV